MAAAESTISKPGVLTASSTGVPGRCDHFADLRSFIAALVPDKGSGQWSPVVVVIRELTC